MTTVCSFIGNNGKKIGYFLWLVPRAREKLNDSEVWKYDLCRLYDYHERNI